MFAVNLKTDYKINPLGIGCPHPLLSWQCADGKRQRAFQISAYNGTEEVWNSGIRRESRTSVYYEPELKSRDCISWKVKLMDESDVFGKWSVPSVFEEGILQQNDWNAKWIFPETAKEELCSDACNDVINQFAKDAWDSRSHRKSEKYELHHPASYLKRKFKADKGKKGRLYITSQGIYEVYLNGMKVGDAVLMPGPCNYNYEMPYQTYDVSDLLLTGENEMLIIIGDGWYRSTSGVDGDRNLYGNRLAVIAQLEIDGRTAVCTDQNWQATQHGPIQQNDLQQGEVYNAETSLDEWHQIEVSAEGKEKLLPMDSVFIKEHETFKGKIIKTPNGETVIDFGQNIAGYVEMKVFAKAGDTIQLFHGEALDADGNFTQENFEDRKRHQENGTYQMVFYRCKEGWNYYKPHFTIMGFRYAKIETDCSLEKAEFIAHAVYSDIHQTASFSCSNKDLNQLFHNCLWSQKSNFCDIPTDCPTRERAGWTGDAEIFAETGLMLMDCWNVYDKWLRQCRYGQYEDGRVANIAPPNKKIGFMTGLLSGSAAWGDACILVPYTIYQMTGDVRVLQDNYAMMKKWYQFQEKRASKSQLKNLFSKNPYKKYTFESGLNYGEWCEPGTNSSASMKNGNYDVATAHFSYSGRILSEIATILKNEDDARQYQRKSELAKQAYRCSFTDDGRISSPRQCQYIRPIQLDLLSKDECVKAADQLNQNVIKNDCHLNTGFLTTPKLCETLAEYGYIDTAYRVLLQDSCPSWLYEVKQGATSVWETWDGHASQNHYSYGSIAGWMISGICGIHYHFNGLVISPMPSRHLQHAEAYFDSPAGRIISEWKYEGRKWNMHTIIPANTSANVILPNGEVYHVLSGEYSYEIEM